MKNLNYKIYIITSLFSTLSSFFMYYMFANQPWTKLFLLSSLTLIIGFIITSIFFYKSLKIKTIILKLLFSILNVIIYTILGWFIVYIMI
jgi:hypothetical protein